MEPTQNKFSLTVKSDKNFEEAKDMPRQTIQNFLNRDSSQPKLSMTPLNSIMKSTNFMYKNPNERLIPTPLSQIKSPPFIKSESKTDADNLETPIHLPPDTPADTFHRKLPSLSGSTGIIKPIPSVKQPMSSQEGDFLGGVANINSLVKTDQK